MAFVGIGVKGVFERQGTRFTIKESEPYLPIKGKQDRHFPAIDKLDYNNHLATVIVKGGWLAYKFTLKNGENSGTTGANDFWDHI